jgi:hypothetical protein
MAFVPGPSAARDERHGLVRPRAQAANPQLRCLSTGLTSEMNKLGMHSTVPCPRRSQIAPTRKTVPHHCDRHPAGQQASGAGRVHWSGCLSSYSRDPGGTNRAPAALAANTNTAAWPRTKPPTRTRGPRRPPTHPPRPPARPLRRARPNHGPPSRGATARPAGSSRWHGHPEKSAADSPRAPPGGATPAARRSGIDSCSAGRLRDRSSSKNRSRPSLPARRRPAGRRPTPTSSPEPDRSATPATPDRHRRAGPPSRASRSRP